MTPIEKAARAVAEYAARRLPPADSAATCEGIARAVLQAIREPSEGMLSDGAFQIFRGERITEDDLDSAKRVWRAMTSRALTE